MTPDEFKQIQDFLKAALQETFGAYLDLMKKIDDRLIILEKEKQAKDVKDAEKKGFEEGSGIGSRVAALEKAGLEDVIWKTGANTMMTNTRKMAWIIASAIVVAIVSYIASHFVR